MAHELDPARREALIGDIFHGRHDVVALAQAHGLSPDELAQWANDAKNRQCLAGLCVLADIQTQLHLSRYRMHAATQLVHFATQVEDQAKSEGESEAPSKPIAPELARKACVDLLRLDLKRADATDADTNAHDSPADLADLRAMLYGTLEGDARPPQEQENA